MHSTCGPVIWLGNDENKLVGVSLGADATAEHEIGTKKLASSFGYDYSASAGVKGRKVTMLPAGFGVERIIQDGQECLLLSSNIERAKGYLKTELRFWETLDQDHNTCAAWDDRNFAILSRGDDIPHLEELAAAFQSLDVMAGGLLAKRAHRICGLSYAIASRVPQDLLDETQRELDETIQRAKILEDSGIHDLLRKAGKRWGALNSTIWADESKTSIRVWLNPLDQRNHDYGWFTLDELRDWAEDKGPIMLRTHHA